MQCQPRHKLTTFVLGPIIRPQASERGGFDDRVHEQSIRLRRIYVKDVVEVVSRTAGAALRRGAQLGQAPHQTIKSLQYIDYIGI